MNTKMYVGNLPFTTTEADIHRLFSEFGAVTEVHLPIDRDTGRPRGFAFVTMDSPESMNAAIAGVNEKPYEGRDLSVNEARPREDRPSYGGGGGGRGGHGGGGGNKRGGGGRSGAYSGRY